MLFSRVTIIALTSGIALSSLGQIPQTAVSPIPKQPEQASAPTLPALPAGAHALEASDVEAFFDGIIPMQLERSDIAGASVLVMKDGQVLLKKGYGYADEKSKKAVDPNSTIFRLASISKLFTWVSVMQLEEQGKLNIDADVNQYLDFQIKPAFGQPISLRELMTHRGGFEEVLKNIIITDPKKTVALRDFLIRNQPERLFAPGTVPGYSNYGVGLASYVVQRVSGEPFEQYVAEHIFTPLGMVHSTFYQPPPKDLVALPSEGYRGNTQRPPVGFEIFNPVGAGGISSTAQDMGRFGQALLNGGELDGKRILKPETLAEMWTPQFRASERLPALGMGFYETWRNDLRWIGHEGDLIAFHSLFFVEPKQKLVLFVSYNSAGGGSKPRPELINMFSDRYFPSTQKQNFIKIPLKELKAIEGTYESTRRADSTKLKLETLFNQRNATVNKDGVLHLENYKDLRGHPAEWKPIGKDLWQEVGEQERLFAICDDHGKIIRLAYDFPGVQSQRVPWYENGKWVIPAVGCSLGILLLILIATLLRTGRRIFLRKRTRIAPQPGTRWLPWFTRLTALVWVALLGTIFIYFTIKGDDLMPPTDAWGKYFFLMNALTLLALLLSLFPVISGLRVWSRVELRWITKVKFSLVALACVLLSWFAIHWHLIGPVHRI